MLIVWVFFLFIVRVYEKYIRQGKYSVSFFCFSQSDFFSLLLSPELKFSILWRSFNSTPSPTFHPLSYGITCFFFDDEQQQDTKIYAATQTTLACVRLTVAFLLEVWLSKAVQNEIAHCVYVTLYRWEIIMNRSRSGLNNMHLESNILFSLFLFLITMCGFALLMLSWADG